jgi:hypothetical protein
MEVEMALVKFEKKFKAIVAEFAEDVYPNIAGRAYISMILDVRVVPDGDGKYPGLLMINGHRIDLKHTANNLIGLVEEYTNEDKSFIPRLVCRTWTECKDGKLEISISSVSSPESEPV